MKVTKDSDKIIAESESEKEGIVLSMLCNMIMDMEGNPKGFISCETEFEPEVSAKVILSVKD